MVEALHAGKDLEKVFFQKNLKSESARQLLNELHESFTPISKVPVQKQDGLTRKNHQGVVAFLSPIKYFSVENLVQRLYENGRSPFIIALDGITDIRNFGAIARTAECLGADGIILPNSNSAQVNGDAIKTSAGALNHLPVCRTASLPEALSYLKNSGLKVVGCSEKMSKTIGEVSFNDPLVLVMGSEGAGISEQVLEVCDEIAKIELLGNVQSLNVSVAAGIFMYEVNRQRY